MRIALVILEDEQGRVVLQLRSNIPSIANPDKWGFFGGHVEEDENPSEAALREVEEELSCTLQQSKLRHLRDWQPETGKKYFLFHYPLSKELDEAQLMEGQRFGFFEPAQIDQGIIDGKEIISYHRKLLLDYWSGEGQQ